MENCSNFNKCLLRYKFALVWKNYTVLLFETAADAAIAAATYRNFGTPCYKVFRVGMVERPVTPCFGYATTRNTKYLEVCDMLAIWGR